MKAIVVGAGVAGVAAAYRLSQRGMQVRLLGSTAGASELTSGAVDGQPWTDDNPSFPSQDALGFMEALDLWEVPQPLPWIATGAGIVRRATALDRALLNLEPLKGGHIAVADVARDDWDAALLTRSFNQSDFARATDTRFSPVKLGLLEAGFERRVPSHDFAGLLAVPERQERLRGALSALASFQGALVGPWLGQTSAQTRALQSLCPVPLGEITSMPGGVAGARLEASLCSLLKSLGLEITEDRAQQLRVRQDRFEVTAASGACWHADLAVVAVGGLISGGLRLGRVASQVQRSAFELSLTSPLELSPSPLDKSVTSLHGFDFSARGLSVLEKVGARLPTPAVAGLAIAGDLVGGAPKTILHAIESGLAAGNVTR